MTDYNPIANSQIDQDSPADQTLFTALRDNPIAISEGGPGATVTRTGWHPFDMINVGDGALGTIWDHAVDGSVSAITTPSLGDGYEYLLYGQLGRGPAGNMSLLAQRQSNSVWETLRAFGVDNSPQTLNIICRSERCRWEEGLPRFLYLSVLPNQSSGSLLDGQSSYDFKASSLQISSSVAFSSGWLRMLRRRDYISG